MPPPLVASARRYLISSGPGRPAVDPPIVVTPSLPFTPSPGQASNRPGWGSASVEDWYQ